MGHRVVVGGGRAAGVATGCPRPSWLRRSWFLDSSAWDGHGSCRAWWADDAVGRNDEQGAWGRWWWAAVAGSRALQRPAPQSIGRRPVPSAAGMRMGTFSPSYPKASLGGAQALMGRTGVACPGRWELGCPAVVASVVEV